jgi:hypothetical protein
MAWLRGLAAIYMTSLLLSNGCVREIGGRGETKSSTPSPSAFFLCFYPLFLDKERGVTSKKTIVKEWLR